MLPHHGAGALVVDIVVPGRVTQPLVRFDNGPPILREDRTGERVRRPAVHQRQHLIPLIVLVHIRREDRAEELDAHDLVLRIGGLEQRRFDEPSFARIAFATGDNTHAGIGFRRDQHLLKAVVGALVDHRAHEHREVGRVAHLDHCHFGTQLLFHARPERARDVAA